MQTSVVAVVALLAVAVGPARAADQPVFGTKLRATVGVAFVAKDLSIVPPAPGTPDAPDEVQWTFESFPVGHPVSNAYTYTTQVGSWTPNAAGTRWKYVDKNASAAIRVAVMKPGTLKVKVQVGSVQYGFGTPVVVVLRGGSLRYCAVFEPDTWVITQGSNGYRFVARNAPAPVACPEPSASPSGAFIDRGLAR